VKTVPLRLVLWLAGGLAMASSVALTLATLRDLEEALPRLEGKAGNVSELRRLGDDVAEYHAAQRMFAELGDGAARVSFDQLVAAALPGHKPEDIRRHRASFGPGWTVEHVEVYLPEVPFESLVPLIEAAETLRPPWRLTKCVLSGSPRAPGTGRATLQFERICRE